MRERTRVVAVMAAIVAMATEAQAQEEGTPARARTTEPSASALPVRLSFEEAIKRSLTRNAISMIAEREIRRADALVEQVRATWLPTLNANATYTRLDKDRSLNGNVILGRDSLGANLQLTLPLVSPTAWVATDRAKEDRDFAKLSLVDARRQAAISAGRAYLTVVAQQRILETSVQARETAKAHEAFSKSRFEGGVGNRLDAVRAGPERATAEARVFNQAIALTRAQEALGILLGENGPIDAGEANLGAPPPLAAALNEAASNRSDVVALRERMDSAQHAVRDSYTEYLPILSAVAQPFYQTPATLTLPTTGWQAQLLLTLPLYDGGLRYGLTHEREAVRDQARIRLVMTVRRARSEVRVAFEAVQRADEALARARAASALAKESLELSLVAYRAGATSNIEVVDAERRSRDAETEAAIAEDTSRQARLDLLAAAGRFP
ncbi:N/A [soil metagenome]